MSKEFSLNITVLQVLLTSNPKDAKGWESSSYLVWCRKRNHKIFKVLPLFCPEHREWLQAVLERQYPYSGVAENCLLYIWSQAGQADKLGDFGFVGFLLVCQFPDAFELPAPTYLSGKKDCSVALMTWSAAANALVYDLAGLDDGADFYKGNRQISRSSYLSG